MRLTLQTTLDTAGGYVEGTVTEGTLRSQVGSLLIIANVVVVALTVVLYVMGGFLFDEMTTILALVVPMFSVYVTPIIKHIIATKTERAQSGAEVSTQYIFISWLFPSLLAINLTTLLLLKAYNVGFSSFTQFRTMFMLSETLFGVYAGIVISSMFGLDLEPRRAIPSTEKRSS